MSRFVIESPPGPQYGKELAAARFIQQVCDTRTAAVFLRNCGWPIQRALHALVGR